MPRSVFNIHVDEQRVHFGVDVFNNLEPEETTHFSDLNLIGKTFEEISVYNSIGGGKNASTSAFRCRLGGYSNRRRPWIDKVHSSGSSPWKEISISKTSIVE